MENVDTHITKGVSSEHLDQRELIVKIGALRECVKDAQVGPEFIKAFDLLVRSLLVQADNRRRMNRRTRLMIHDL